MSGYSKDELLVMNVSDLEVIDSSIDIEKRINKLRIDKFDRFESIHRRKDNTEFIVEINIQYQSIDEDQFIVFINDITDRKHAEEKIMETKQFYENIIEGVQDGIWVTDEKDDIYFANKAMGVIAGIPPEKIQGNNLLKDFPEETTGELISYYKQAKKEKKLIWYEIEVKTPSGRNTWQNGWLIPLLFNNSFAGIICTIRDITERKQAEFRINEASIIASNAEKAAEMGSWNWIMNSSKVGWSDNMCRLHGIEPSEYDSTFKQATSFQHPDDMAYVNKQIERMLAEKKSQPFEYRIVTSDGKTKWVEGTNQLLFDEKGEIREIVGTVQDITERKQAEELLKESEEQLRNIFENSTNLHYSHTIDHIITYLSPQVEEILGYTQEEAMVNWTELVSDNPINKTGYQKTVKAIETGERQPAYELEMLRKDGRKIIVEVRESPIIEDGKTVSIVGSLNDITERKQAEKALETRMKELEIFNDAAVNRELKMIRLQKEINEMLEKMGKEARYDIVK